MLGRDALLASKVILAVFASLLALPPASSGAQSRYDQRPLFWDRPEPRTPLEVWLSGEGWDEDYLSSHVCINGFRWMTKNVEHAHASAADDAVPVRC